MRRYHSFVSDSDRWNHVRFRDGDIVISTPPKCGTTWMQMLCALLIFRTPDLPAPLAELSPWLDMLTRPLDDVLDDLDAQDHRRFLKTHTPFDGIPSDPSVTYLFVGRDPRDVALSWDNHMANLDLERFAEIRIGAVGTDDLAQIEMSPPEPPPTDPVERFFRWVEHDGGDNDVSGLASLVRHAATFWERRNDPNVHLFHYGDLRADLAGEMARLADALDVAAPDEVLVKAGTFEAMKARADDLVPNSDTPFWHDNRRFFDQGRSGAWRAILDDESGVERYRQAVRALARPDLVEWLHQGEI